MLKRFFKMFAMLFVLITIISHTGQEVVFCLSYVNSLWFYSLEEFFDAYIAAREDRVSSDPGISRITAHVDFASLDEIHLLTNLPETFRLYRIRVFDEAISVFYIPIDEDTGEQRSDAVLNNQYFHLHVFLWTYEDLESWGINSPLDGIMRQIGREIGVDLTEKDLIDGKYLFCERTRTLYWAQGSNRFRLRMPIITNEDNDVTGLSIEELGLAAEFSINDMLKFTETVTIDLQNEINIAAWSAGDFSMFEELLEPEKNTASEPMASSNTPTLRFTVGNSNFLHNGIEKQAETAPFISQERTMVPLRIIAEALNAEVDWDSATRTVIIAGRGETINLIVDVPLPNDMGTPVIVNGSTFVPVRYVSETLGATVQWDGEYKAVYII
ncbi:MAG: copper amine oxidase N-terminal domain-containing protein [Defluviitaleaceae bacterium]|nr:copper amine oxidase N-terminal domain-containing protein [Defluviitaleaceae bacterium]